MNADDFRKRAETVIALSEVFGKRMSGDAVAIFVRATSKIPTDHFSDAIGKASEQCRFMPTPVEFQELSGWRPPSQSADEVNSAWRARWGSGRV